MDAKKLIKALESVAANATCQSPRRYSGRGMRGRECVGVVVPSGTTTFEVGVQLAMELIGEPDLVEDLACLDAKEDSMGIDAVIYFPQVEWPADLAEGGA